MPQIYLLRLKGQKVFASNFVRFRVQAWKRWSM